MDAAGRAQQRMAGRTRCRSRADAVDPQAVPCAARFEVLFGRAHGFTGWSLQAGARRELGLPPWTMHDIRRCVATELGDIGIQPHIIEEILNHHRGHRRGVAGTYNRSPYEREVRAAMLRWSTHVAEITSGGKRKVVAFPQATALERA